MASPLSPLASAMLGQGREPIGPIPLASMPAVAPTLADAWTQNTRSIGDWIGDQRAISAKRGLWDDQGMTVAGARDAGGQLANALMMGTTAPRFRAFHGSPHDFERFDASKIGTGEGAQAYGHGLYVAENEGVAREYRDALSGPTFNGVPYSQVDAPWRARDALRWVAEGGDVKTLAQAADRLQTTADDFTKQAGAIKGSRFQAENDRLASLAKEHADAAKWLKENASGDLQKGGHMYEVNVNADPAHFLDWDKPLAEQSPQVQAKIANLQTRNMLPRGWTPDDMAQLTGGHLYQELGHTAGSSANVARLLAEPLPGTDAGVPGIRYLDGGSRSTGEGTSNHVVFDDSTLEILRKYGLAGLMAGGAAAGAASGNGDVE